MKLYLFWAVSIPAAAIVLAGCATQYVAPAGGPISTIEFTNEAPKPMSVHLHGGSAECTDRRSAGLVKPESVRKVAVPAGSSFVFTAGVDTGNPSAFGALGAAGGIIAALTYKGCTPTIEFVPEANRAYLFRMTSDGKDCSYQFTTQDSNGKVQPVMFTAREWIRASTEAGPFCRKK